MEAVGRFCFYNKEGTCYFVRNQPGKCNLCPNFISFKREALSLSASSSLPVNYFDLTPLKGEGDSLQTSLA
ncbi:MAG: hypothetical protein QW062_00480 [Thermoplasmatales archaeon]